MLENVFVGRKVELKKLQELYGDVNKGKPRTVFLCGESGIGKRALAEEFVKRHRDCLAIRYNCTSAEKKTPLALLFGLLKQKDKGLARTPKLRARIDSILKGLVGKRGAIEDMGKEKEEFYAEVVTLFSDLSKKKTLLLFIDNFQWADHSSVTLLSHLATTLKRARTMIIAAYSQELEGEDFISESIALLALEGKAYVMMLERFDEPTSKELLEKMLETKVTENLSRRVYEEARGHPLFTTSMLTSLVERGIVDPRDKVWMQRFEQMELELPKSVKELIMERTKLLDEDSQRVLRAASVLGTHFRLDILANTLRTDERHLHDRLSRLTESKLIYQVLEAESESYGFDHARVRETIYHEMGSRERKELHKMAGDAYESLFGEEGGFAYQLANHFALSGQHEKAFRYAIVAGDSALQHNAPEEAVRHFEDSMASLKRAKVKNRTRLNFEILVRLGDAYFITGNWKKVHKCYKDALDVSVESRSRIMISLANRKLGELLRFKGEYTKAREHFEEALSISRRIKDSRGVADSFKGLGYLYWRQGNYAKASEFYDKCIKAAQELKDEELLGVAILEKGNVSNTMGDLGRAMELYKRCIPHLEKVNNLSQIARVYNNMGDVSLQRQKWNEAIDYFERSRTAAENIGGRYMVAWSLFNEAEALARLGKSDEAIEKCEQSREILSSLGDRMGLLAVYKNFAIAYGLKKDWKRSEENFRKSLAIARELKIPDVIAEIYLHHARMLATKGDRDKAVNDLSMALNIAKEIKAKRWIARIEKELDSIR